MGLRPGRCYRTIHRANTRVSTRKPRRSYVKGVPKPKITVFELGVKGNYEKVVYLVSDRDIQIRHNSLEAARVAAVRELEKKLLNAFFFKVRVFPHHIIRENPLATGAGADRFQQGMRMSFGKPIGTAAQVRAGQKLMEIRVNAANVSHAKKAFRAAIFKLPTTCKIEVADL
ncbi:MAG: 50S ribosomal protein L16 [Candidatus Aenigmarchaeota archaeon]|nr:50S ribosomal protein L16 [Candidatus Aenigmarchaeota archaeon]